MEEKRWLNPGQPQTLQAAVFLLYLNAAFAAILGGLTTPIGIVLIAGRVGAGFGIASEQRWGYGLGLTMAALPFAIRLFLNPTIGGFIGADVLGLMFEIALVALLLHPQSRDYQRIWFK